MAKNLLGAGLEVFRKVLITNERWIPDDSIEALAALFDLRESPCEKICCPYVYVKFKSVGTRPCLSGFI